MFPLAGIQFNYILLYLFSQSQPLLKDSEIDDRVILKCNSNEKMWRRWSDSPVKGWKQSARLLVAQELTVWYDKNWQNYWVPEKLLHSPRRILTSSGTYWHTDLFITKDIVDHSVTIYFIIYWVTFANFFNSLFYYMIICLFVLNIYLIIYVLICFKTM